MVASFMGDPGRVRVFLDGLELIELDPPDIILLDMSLPKIDGWEAALDPT